MAQVSLFTVWVWECPLCNRWIKAWQQTGCAHAGWRHLAEHHEEDRDDWFDLEPLPYQKIWAFNVVRGSATDDSGLGIGLQAGVAGGAVPRPFPDPVADHPYWGR